MSYCPHNVHSLRLSDYELDANDEMYEQYTVQTVVSAQYRKLYAVVSIDCVLNCVLLSYTLCLRWSCIAYNACLYGSILWTRS